jgi:hypothetical protein
MGIGGESVRQVRRYPLMVLVLLVLVFGCRDCPSPEGELAELRAGRASGIENSGPGIVHGTAVRPGSRLEPDGNRPRHLELLVLPTYSLNRGIFSGRTIETRRLIASDPDIPMLLRDDLRLWRDYAVPVQVACEGRWSENGDALTSMVREAAEVVNELAGEGLLELQEACAPREVAGIQVHAYHDVGERIAFATWTTLGCTYASPPEALCEPQWMHSAQVWLTPAAGVNEVVHELLHILGLEHTCVVPSVMATEFDDWELLACSRERWRHGLNEPLQLQRRVSQYDAAALHLLLELGRLINRQVEAIRWVVMEGGL